MNLADASTRAAVSVLNGSGRILAAAGWQIPALDQRTLLRSAMRRAGGLEDLGDWSLEEPLERLLNAYHAQPGLTTLGRITVRETLVSLLENLLRMQHESTREPAILAEKIQRPVFITGLPRTGSTLLHGLLTADQDNRVPLTWEVMYPTATALSAREINRTRKTTDARLEWANRLAPEFRRIHPIAADLPQECIAIQAQVFRSIQFHTTHDVPDYEDWLEAGQFRPAYEFHRRLLQHLQYHRRAARWVLKAPGHLFSLDALLETYPDAMIVQTHRDPLRVVASMASLASVLKRAFARGTDARTIGADWARRWANALDRFLAIRDRHPQARFLDIHYDQLMRAPLETVEEIYRFSGARLDPKARDAMQAFLDRNPQNKFGRHRYTLADFGLEREVQLQRFKAYCERFDIAVREA